MTDEKRDKVAAVLVRAASRADWDEEILNREADEIIDIVLRDRVYRPANPTPVAGGGFNRRRLPRVDPVSPLVLAPQQPIGFITDRADAPTSKAAAPRQQTSQEQSRMLGFTGDMCTQCQNFTMRRNGICMKCDTCGSTTGCS